MSPELSDDNFTMAWRRVVEEAKQSAAPDLLLFIGFTFSNDLTQDELLDRIKADLEDLLTDPDFRAAMRWDKNPDR
jgi:hypothetical protein